ncbi:hypothetical protein U9K52_08575 [Chryseobacterium sp. MHB01]|uniref:hypothetical protein n=1 Tax=Chryseobacterium sp. MHB01 TaxID=3109433 RepID=UPI002AFDE65E|nr:hypothetical protein [Chryseobacterium sp. MHB01]MEA1848963.1 hypothetical protein [Chryseobacterium sp. MHB01]
MESIQAKVIHNILKKESRLKAVELHGFIKMLHVEGKCNDEMLSDVEKYIEMLAILYKKYDGLSVYKIQKKPNPFEPADFALFTKYHVELNAFLDLAKQKMK